MCMYYFLEASLVGKGPSTATGSPAAALFTFSKAPAKPNGSDPVPPGSGGRPSPVGVSPSPGN